MWETVRAVSRPLSTEAYTSFALTSFGPRYRHQPLRSRSGTVTVLLRTPRHLSRDLTPQVHDRGDNTPTGTCPVRTRNGDEGVTIVHPPSPGVGTGEQAWKL